MFGATALDTDDFDDPVPPGRREGAASEATPAQNGALRRPPILDTRGLTKVPHFSGKDQDWGEFCFRFESYTALLGLETMMEIASSHRGPILMDGEGEDAKTASRTLFHLLVQTTEGKALKLLRACPRNNGAEAWRLLKSEYEPAIAGRFAAVLQSLLSPTFAPNRDFLEQLTEWETAVTKWEMQSGETLSASIKVAVILKHAPPRLREVVRVLQIDCRDYPKLREVLKQYLQSGRQFSGDGISVESAPMEIDYLARGSPFKGKGKGKKGSGKGASSGKSGPGPQPGQSAASSSTETRSCHTCGKVGHLAKNCPQNTCPPRKERGR